VLFCVNGLFAGRKDSGSGFPLFLFLPMLAETAETVFRCSKRRDRALNENRNVQGKM